jgi:hypothetical protein
LRGIGRLVLPRDLPESFAPSRDSPVGVRVGAVVVDKMRSPMCELIRYVPTGGVLQRAALFTIPRLTPKLSEMVA